MSAHHPGVTPATRPRLIVDTMRLADIPEVMAIERASFPVPWSEQGYQHELLHNELAHYLVLRLTSERPAGTRRWLPRLVVGSPPTEIIGYAGYWLIVDEAHITTIAVAPSWRRRGLGEWLLVHLLAHAAAHGARTATLEVRVSNRGAQKLYEKYRFQVVGERKRYYSDGEDAILMTLWDVRSPTYQHFLAQRRRALLERLEGLFALQQPDEKGEKDRR